MSTRSEKAVYWIKLLSKDRKVLLQHSTLVVFWRNIGKQLFRNFLQTYEVWVEEQQKL
ncbi:hypothetical protein [Dolichospermum circinale]|uniref:hypothetical protein n=1 Tax=Dolichospermum circinale TaxID=109265 RepID=UPI0012DDEA9A|nr:hypothetical protein [Dolichospermum circinale]MDB9477211.1 hypothetical protein [Dolichospermum circinale CS-537/03]MDB9483442.1 hypothetical protein [Dolichospermum circinale CS-537/05]